MTRFAPRRRAEDFSAVVDATGGTGGTDLETARMLGVVSQLRAEAEAVDAAQVRSVFRDDLRARLMSEASTALAPLAAARATARGTVETPHASLVLPHRPRTRRERRVAVVAAAALLVGGTAGMAGAAQHALPGEALYPVKRGIEGLDARFAGSDADRGRDLLRQASTRLEEARQLSAGSPEQAAQVSGTIEVFTDQAREGSGLLLDSYHRDQDEDAVRAVRSSAARDLESLTDMADEAPAQARSRLVDAATALRGIDADARGACPTCSSLPTLPMPRVFSTTEEVQRALAAADRTQLDNDHPFVAPKDLVHVLAGASAPASPEPGVRSSAGPAGGSSPAATPRSGSSTHHEPKLPLPTPKAPVLPLPTSGPIGGSVSSGGGLGDGLGGLLGTLLPDPTKGPGLLGLD